ncbi:hypothetical protein BH11PAT2_BH11PAT2_06160 [soil metagenome]
MNTARWILSVFVIVSAFPLLLVLPSGLGDSPLRVFLLLAGAVMVIFFIGIYGLTWGKEWPLYTVIVLALTLCIVYSGYHAAGALVNKAVNNERDFNHIGN